MLNLTIFGGKKGRPIRFGLKVLNVHASHIAVEDSHYRSLI
jgi:hypothetical protein